MKDRSPAEMRCARGSAVAEPLERRQLLAATVFDPADAFSSAQRSAPGGGSYEQSTTPNASITLANAPPTANAGGPYAIGKGQSLRLDASASSDPDNDALTFAWDVNGDNVFADATGVNPSLSWQDLRNLGIGPGQYAVRVRASDPAGFPSESQTSLTVYAIADLRAGGRGPFTSFTPYGMFGGQVVGSADVAPDVRHAFAYATGPAKTLMTTDLGTLGGASSEARAIDSAADVAGWSDTASGARHAFLDHHGQMTDLGTLGGPNSEARGIGGGGVVGVADTATGTSHAFLYDAGQMRDLGTLGGGFSEALDVNALAQVVGSSLRADGTTHGFLYAAGQMTDLGTQGGSYSAALGINDYGEVVGYSYLPDGSYHAFLYSGGRMTDLGTMGGQISVAEDVDNFGEVVGHVFAAGAYRAFLFRDANGNGASDPNEMTDLNTLVDPASGWSLTDATDISPLSAFVPLPGAILGAGTHNGQPTWFRLDAFDAPPVADAGGAYDVTEGRGVALDAGLSFDPDDDALSYAWDLNGDGDFSDAAGVAPSLVWSDFQRLGMTDGGTFPIAVRVSDEYGARATASATLTVHTVAVVPTGPAFVVNTHTDDNQGVSAGDALRPSRVAADAAGDYVVVWESIRQDGDRFKVYAQRFGPSGERLGGEFPVSPATGSEQTQPTVAMDAAGDFVITWTNFDPAGTSYDVFARRFDAAGVPRGGEFRVHTDGEFAEHQVQPSVAMDAAGGFVVVWQESVFGGHIAGRRFDAAANPVGEEFDVETETNFSHTRPAVASSPAGSFVVTWEDVVANGDEDVFARRYSAAGVPLGDAFRVNTMTTGLQYESAVAVDEAGRFVFTWTGFSPDDSGQDVYARRFDAAGQPLGDDFRVNADPTGYQQLSRVAALPGSGFVVAWERVGNGPLNGIYARRFTAAGEPDGREFRVSQSDTYPSEFPFVAADGTGGFMVAWHQDGPAPGGTDFYARRYTASGADPVVVGAWANGSRWAPAFRDRLQSDGLGDADAGFALNSGSTGGPLPWNNLDQLSVRFNNNVPIGRSDLMLDGATMPAYAVADFAYDPDTFTATWTLDRPLALDRVRLSLSGLADAGGNPLADLALSFDVVPGDADRNGRVDAFDTLGARAKQGSNLTANSANYSPFYDVDGNGRIDAFDVLGIKARQGTNLDQVPVPPAPVEASLVERMKRDRLLV